MIWLIGAGPMSVEYAKVCKALNLEFQCVTRSLESATWFYKQTHKPAIEGGLNKFIQQQSNIPDYAIVATGIELLSSVTAMLLKAGVKSILVEKPGGLTFTELKQTELLANEHNAKVFVAYNRRFYASVVTARKKIIEDGGVISFNFEVTEWSSIIEKLTTKQQIKENWFTGNTSHVVDLAFYLGGRPSQLSCFTSGSTAWHKRSATFAGAGISTSQALFSYHGNWQSAGRWNLELQTAKRRYIFRPLEKLQVQELGSVNINEMDIDDSRDIEFKPGIYEQTRAFFNDEYQSMCHIGDQLIDMQTYYKMANYSVETE